MERDGETMAEICEILNTNVLQVKNDVSILQKVAEEVDKEKRQEADVFDWSAISRSLESTLEDDTSPGGARGAVIGSMGAYWRQPFGNVWSAWRTASIFIRTDVTVAEKIRLNREKVVALDVVALKGILRVAYELCTDWTEFICTHATNGKHPTIESNCIRDFYKIALEDLKEELKQQFRAARQRKLSPVGFAAPETAHMMEKDGPRAGLITKVTTTFSHLKDILEDWNSFGTWIIVYPIEGRGEKAVIEGVVNLAKKHVEEGGVVVTAWTPVTSQNAVKWTSMIRLWTAMDAVLSRCGGPDHVITTASPSRGWKSFPGDWDTRSVCAVPQTVHRSCCSKAALRMYST
ncbi:unnamed protein product [Heligmosomoides polygyrus]|uniref:TIR domain-containing protein n=1 Tax=Heligmosomoides polygyrus TaxID=6339 RepID=A0A183GFA8_HELPZ|nr:unnamed protein product [Heligmosomoides polygyrus]